MDTTPVVAILTECRERCRCRGKSNLSAEISFPILWKVGPLTTLIRRVQAHRKRDEGASAVEYGLLVALIAVVIAATVVALGIALNNKFQKAQTCVAANPPVAASC